MNEFDIIRRYFAPLAAGEGTFDLTNDAAVLQIPQNSELVITKDAIVEGVHFTGNESADLIARKLLRVNLSDLAAMGAKPYGYFLALMLSPAVDESWIYAFTEGLRIDQEKFGITLMGGDTTSTPVTLSFSLTALGLLPQGQALRRSGAKPGDDIYVTGTIGDAALGLNVATGHWPVNTADHRSQAADHYLLQRYQLPSPRVELGQRLVGLASACMDVSDGLMQDLGHIAECSQTGAVIHWDKIPLSDAAKMALPSIENPYETVAGGGDDYELLFTAPPVHQQKLASIARELSLPLTHIGSIKEGREVKMIDKNGKDIYLSNAGFNHFRPK